MSTRTIKKDFYYNLGGGWTVGITHSRDFNNVINNAVHILAISSQKTRIFG